MLKRAGLRLVYCAEQFENDGSPTSTIIKGVKRAMAGEYSRELEAWLTKEHRGSARPRCMRKGPVALVGVTPRAGALQQHASSELVRLLIVLSGATSVHWCRRSDS